MASNEDAPRLYDLAKASENATVDGPGLFLAADVNRIKLTPAFLVRAGGVALEEAEQDEVAAELARDVSMLAELPLGTVFTPVQRELLLGFFDCSESTDDATLHQLCLGREHYLSIMRRAVAGHLTVAVAIEQEAQERLGLLGRTGYEAK